MTELLLSATFKSLYHLVKLFGAGAGDFNRVKLATIPFVGTEPCAPLILDWLVLRFVHQRDHLIFLKNSVSPRGFPGMYFSRNGNVTKMGTSKAVYKTDFKM